MLELENVEIVHPTPPLGGFGEEWGPGCMKTVLQQLDSLDDAIETAMDADPEECPVELPLDLAIWCNVAIRWCIRELQGIEKRKK